MASSFFRVGNISLYETPNLRREMYILFVLTVIPMSGLMYSMTNRWFD